MHLNHLNRESSYHRKDDDDMSNKIIKWMLLIIFLKDSLAADICYLNDVHALILARGGSKGIKNKNLVQINGESILKRTITKIKSCGLFVSVWVSTDSINIAEEALKAGALVHKRPIEYADDNTSSIISVNEFLTHHSTINRLALFQCTSPFLKVHYIKEAFDLFKTHDCVFAVQRSHKLRWRQTKNREIIPINFDLMKRPRRQDWPGELVETGMFYFSSRLLIEKEHRFQNEKCGVVEVQSRDSLEIDTYDDVLVANCLDATPSIIKN